MQSMMTTANSSELSEPGRSARLFLPANLLLKEAIALLTSNRALHL
jgi:hypothetical protein